MMETSGRFLVFHTKEGLEVALRRRARVSEEALRMMMPLAFRPFPLESRKLREAIVPLIEYRPPRPRPGSII